MQRIEAINILQNKSHDGMISVAEAQKIVFEIDEGKKEVHRLQNRILQLEKQNKELIEALKGKKSYIEYLENFKASLIQQNVNLLRLRNQIVGVKVEE